LIFDLSSPPLVTIDTPDASAAMILLHGRGDSARGILGLVDYLKPGKIRFLAPEAEGRQWYPETFLAPRERNAAHIEGAFNRISAIIQQLEAEGMPRKRIVLLGFSQGACLASDYAAHHPTRYGGVVALSGGLIGEAIDPAHYAGELGGTPVFFGCSDIDFYIPENRVHESAAVLQILGAEVTTRIYPGMAHTVNQEELDWVNSLLKQLVA